MTLTRLLEIKRDWILYEHERGLQLAERIWLDRGAPCKAEPLCDVLETILQRCVEEGICYPPILLRRRKELQRGAWSPVERGSVSRGYQTPTPQHPSCPECGGSGIIVIPGGRSGSLCMKCKSWERTTGAKTLQ
jgi:hypothetical protein